MRGCLPEAKELRNKHLRCKDTQHCNSNAIARTMPTAHQSTLGRLLLGGLALLVAVTGWARLRTFRTGTTYAAIPPFRALPPHFAPPEVSRWGRGAKAPYPTGAWWLNAALGNVPVPALPYQVAVTDKGAQLSYGFRRRRATTEAQIDPFGVDWFAQPVDFGEAARVAAQTAARVAKVQQAAGGFVASGDALYGWNASKNATLERRSALGVTANYGGVGVVICKGSPLVTIEVDKGQSLVLAPGGASAVNGNVKDVQIQKDPRLRLVTLHDNSTWVLVSLGCDVSLSKNGEVFGVTASKKACVLRIGIAPQTTEDWTVLERAAGAYAVGGEPEFNLDKDPGTYHLRWDTRGDGDLYMLAAPHHVDTLIDASISEGRSYLTGAKGPMTWFKGASWPLREALPDVGLTSAAFTEKKVDEKTRALITEQCGKDAGRPHQTRQSEKGGYGSLYFEGKELGRLARLALVCADAGATQASEKATADLAVRLGRWLSRDDVVGRDKTWGGTVARSGYPVNATRGATGDAFGDFGNALYSDHHFQFGYYAYAGAVVKALHADGPALLHAWRPRLDALVLDYANPPKGSASHSSHFPVNGRHKDWYDGHSWATGLVAYPTGKSQESSSEAAHGYLGAALYGTAIGDDALANWGRLCLATEVRGAKTYWRMNPEGDIYDAAFAANRVAGGVAGGAAVATTWFGSNPEFVHGINVIPVLTGLTDLLIDGADACAEAPILNAALSREAPAPPVAPEWRGFAVASLAATDPHEAWSEALELDDAAFDDGASKANLLHWVAAARAMRPAPSCGSMIALNATQLPWNASEVDKTCDGNLACVALGLSGLCCPQKDGYMFGCCPVLK